jgi:hypothetical protein
LSAIAARRVLSIADSGLAFWLSELSKPHGEVAGFSRLEAHLRRYMAKNTFDYFIHKDLCRFLRRELDFYIKNEVMHLDDIESETASRVEQYQPLLYMDSNVVEISPVPLNKGERLFVQDMKAYYDKSENYFADKQLYLLRNLSKGKGIGFFEAGNFHPDFIVWLLVGDHQFVIFVDPKGIRNLERDGLKMQFYTTIKDIERRLGDPSVRLESFIISNTASHTMELL